jgi:Flp pilus assembly protein TadD
LALEGNFAEAQAQFEEVVRLRPDDAEAHLNLGIALARQQRFEKALEQFQATIRLDPRNPKAREFTEAINEAKSRQPAH